MPNKRFHVVATIYDKRGRALSIGVNSYDKTHPIQAYYANKVGLPHKIYLHTEASAILKLKHPWKAHAIKVERYNSKGKPVNAKPCPVCQAMIDAIGIKKVEHT
jgi:deoxycytidylate deaminase